MSLSKSYEPSEFESKLYEWWETNKFFKPEKLKKLGLIDDNTPAYCITLPPPNITGVLHLGHAMIITIEDIMIRHARMTGKNTLFLPGVDHAGIATQAVVERELNKKGIKRKEIGREKFLEHVWAWKEKSHGIITNQSRKMGMSSDWDREAFTMDDNLANAVREAFVTLFERNLIYRGSYLVNWCPGRCETAISSLEADSIEKKGKLYFIKYPIIDTKWKGPINEWKSGSWANGATKFIEIATTRPETLLGDSAVATRKDHPKFAKLIGKTAILPVLGRKLKIIDDEYVDPEFGTGALKITPAHDMNDYEIGKRHNLDSYSIFTKKAKIKKEFGGGFYDNKDRFKVRNQIVEDLENEGLLIKIEEYNHSVPHCSRCESVIELRDSLQWFVKTKPIADKVLKEMHTMNFIPNKFSDQFRFWMENIQDWCISRQLWWGHRIPVWYCQNCENVMSFREDPTNCPKCESVNLTQDEDVLDTWFSSALWPFSTMGWPNQTDDLMKYYPNTTRESGYDILLFWMAREAMMGMELTGKIVYKNVYLHGLIRNEEGRKISKSMENIDEYDPLLIINKYGADTLRLTLATYSAAGLDMNLDPKNLDGIHKFGIKIWQAVRFVLSNIPENYTYKGITDLNYDKLEPADKWILSELNLLIQGVNSSFEEFNFLNPARDIRTFFWNKFADWYIEISKIRLYSQNEVDINPIHILIHIIDTCLRLLHPFTPFITEKLWQELPSEVKQQEALIVSKWPEINTQFIRNDISNEFEHLMEVIVSIRRIRAEYTVPYSNRFSVLISSEDYLPIIQRSIDVIQYLATIGDLTVATSINPPKKVISSVIGKSTIYIPLEGLIEVEEELSRLSKEIGKLEKTISGLTNKLNGEFSKRAPQDLVNSENEKLAMYQDNLEKLKE
ncbi:MAG: valine--tRNA ligase, partial [Candidatus Heimdallarchaeota archaeon]|nr:valine--tRNA ligase [Candidatus Heimdallarchaeota archaeon]